ncbi:hypothetical protein [Xenorhabdus bovienii]|uniref:Uncharacterized protein n=1 Tax=Xenorhabdus bovienii TaxID=40576 RepID=A0A0B6XBN3_XENBV|nr:hypothetical protein [Xenorhabdus bovienii]CDM89679.1 protein of unknown function [Xenorhabdus bovienii]
MLNKKYSPILIQGIEYAIHIYENTDGEVNIEAVDLDNNNNKINVTTSYDTISVVIEDA